MKKLTLKILKKRFSYNRRTGFFTRKANFCGMKGTVVTTENGASGHLQLVIMGKKYMASSLAWMYVHGRYPKRWVDHKDLNPKNNKIKNLRLATPQQNKFNIRCRSDSRTGIKCVQPHGNRFRVVITKGGKRHSIGSFETPELARAAHHVAVKKLHGSFARAA